MFTCFNITYAEFLFSVLYKNIKFIVIFNLNLNWNIIDYRYICDYKYSFRILTILVDVYDDDENLIFLIANEILQFN